MKKPPRELVDAFLEWYASDPHSQNEDHYAGVVTKEHLEELSREEFIQLFFQFAHDGGMVQSGGERSASRFRKTIEADYDEFRAFALQPFEPGFNEVQWLESIGRFNHFGQGLATIYLNRIDKKRFVIINNKAVEAVELFGVVVPVVVGKRYEVVRDAWRQLIEWFPEFDNYYRTDALSQFLIGEKAGAKWANELRGEVVGTGVDVGKRYWIYAPGEQARLWDEFREKGLMGIGWDAVAEDLSTYGTEDEVRAAYEKWYGDRATTIDGKMLCAFVNTVREGDGVFVKRGTKVIVGYGEVGSPYFYDEKREEYRHLRKATWSSVGEWNLPEGMKALPVKTLTEVKDAKRVAELLKLVGGSVVGSKVNGPALFSKKTFALLAELHEHPLVSFYTEHGEEFAAHVEGPLQELMHSVADRLPAQMLELLETGKRLFARIPKNDYGKGGAWDFYWGAFYPKGGKRTADPQLFLWINRNLLGFGFYVGEYGPDPRKRFVKNCAEHAAVLKRSLEPGLSGGDLVYGEGDTAPDASQLPLGGGKLAWNEWIVDPERFGIRVAIELPSADVESASRAALADLVAETYKRLFPLVLLAHHEQPMDAIRRFLGAEVPPEEEKNPAYTLDQFAKEAYLPREELERWVRAVRRKKQAIFYGPPGTGKTYVAQRLARHLIGGGDGFSEILQFHPSYAYEDFMQGLRPKALKGGGLEYAMVPGRFKDFCVRASECKDVCVLVIDEINRANLARVFGELMFLLEYREESVPLAGGERFKIPGNALVIGTMNTADRSIALVDHALRRRFAFLALYPNYDILSRYHTTDTFKPEGLIKVLQRVNTAINDRHYSVGVSFFLEPGIKDKVQDVWQMEIEPYLEEIFFDKPEMAAGFAWEKVGGEILGV